MTSEEALACATEALWAFSNEDAIVAWYAKWWDSEPETTAENAMSFALVERAVARLFFDGDLSKAAQHRWNPYPVSWNGN